MADALPWPQVNGEPIPMVSRCATHGWIMVDTEPCLPCAVQFLRAEIARLQAENDSFRQNGQWRTIEEDFADVIDGKRERLIAAGEALYRTPGASEEARRRWREAVRS